MGKYLDFEKEEKGYKSFYADRVSLKNNIGKKICWVNIRYVDPHRGYYSVDHGIIHSVKYSTLYLNDGDQEVDIRDIAESGIKDGL